MSKGRSQYWKRGQPELRCTAMRSPSISGARCQYDGEPGTDPVRCVVHMDSGDRRGREGHHMSRFYLKNLRPTLAAKLEELVDKVTPIDQLDLSEEIGLMRAQAGDAVQMYAEACEMPDSDPRAQQARLIAGQMMSSRIKDVMAVIDQAGKTEELKVKLQTAFAQVMTSVISSVAHAAWEVFGDDHKVREFTDLIRSKLEVRNIDVEGTDLTPDRDAIQMDDSIPAEPAEESEVES